MKEQITYSDIITDLSHFGMIKVSGNDAKNFLQGQSTNDIRLVTTKQSQLNAFCSPKGRIIVNFRVCQAGENAYYLLLPLASVTATLQLLQKYVIYAAVKLEDYSDKLLRFGIAGANSPQILADCLGCIPPTEINAISTIEQVMVLQVEGIQPRFMLFSETESKLLQCLREAVPPTVTATWQLLDILSGVPQIVPAIAEEFVPQMVNYHRLDGVSFTKGCYTGQEVVARMQYLGSLKRRMYLAKIVTDSLPQAGDKLFIGSKEQNVGKIVNAQIYPEGGIVVLAVIQIEYAETDTIHLLHQQGKPLQLMDLPYSLS